MKIQKNKWQWFYIYKLIKKKTDRDPHNNLHIFRWVCCAFLESSLCSQASWLVMITGWAAWVWLTMAWQWQQGPGIASSRSGTRIWRYEKASGFSHCGFMYCKGGQRMARMITPFWNLAQWRFTFESDHICCIGLAVFFLKSLKRGKKKSRDWYILISMSISRMLIFRYDKDCSPIMYSTWMRNLPAVMRGIMNFTALKC